MFYIKKNFWKKKIKLLGKSNFQSKRFFTTKNDKYNTDISTFPQEWVKLGK